MSLEPDVNTIADFLERIAGPDYYHLCKINPRKKNAISVSTLYSVDQALDWILAAQEHGYNIYDQWNQPARQCAKRAQRKDIRWLSGFHLDIDLPEDSQRNTWLNETADRLLEFGTPHLVMSGNGLQARWPFEEPRKATPELIAEVEGINKRLIRYFGAGPAGTWEINRLLRVPGTLNFPDAKKQAKGFRTVNAELWDITRDFFTAEDFAKLPRIEHAPRESKSSYRIDFLKRDYTPNYVPLSYEDLLAIDPIIEDHALEKLDGSDYDRSTASFTFITDAIKALCYDTDTEAENYVGDTNVYKNIAELVLASNIEGILTHFDDNGWAKVGSDTHSAMCKLADQKLNTDRKRAKRESRIKQHEDRRDDAKLSSFDHRINFVVHVRDCMELEDLPNCQFTANDVACTRQSATESNIRMIMHKAGIIAKWDAMRDKPLYDVRLTAGQARKRDSEDEQREAREAPHRHFHGAMARTGADMLSAAQESLLADAIHERGIGQREKLPRLLEIIAKEHRFHPIEAYATAAPWDGRDHIGDVAACVRTGHPLIQDYMRVFFRQCIAAVRSLQEYLKGRRGVQIRAVPVLVGPQFIGKSTFWEKITPDGFLAAAEGGLKLGTHKEEDSKRECLSGLVAVLNEIGSSLRRSEMDALKNFLSSRYDEFRTAYAHWPTAKPRMTQFVGTANELYLKDQTGSTRFLAMEVAGFDFARLADIDLQQCYAQAWHDVMLNNVQWWLTDDQERIRAELNEGFRDITEEEAVIDSYLANVGDRHIYKWLSPIQIATFLNYRRKDGYVLRRMTAQCIAAGLSYQDKLFEDGKPTKQHVIGFPILPEKFADLVSL